MLIQQLKNIFIPQRKLAAVLASIIILSSQNAQAISFLLPKSPQDSLIREFSEGANKQTIASKDEDLLDIARRFDLGQNEIIRLNPDVDRWLPGAGTKIQLQSERLLPDAPRTGLVLNLPEFRLYYFPKPEKDKPPTVITHPISIGRQDWETPLGQTQIVQKKENPTWTPPESIKKEHAAKGDPLPDVVPAGPNNPLGLFAMRLGIPGYLIHSTNKPYGVGLRVSHGCIRMYPEDISRLFPSIKVGDPVTIVNQAVKVGWSGDDLYIEAHPPLENHQTDNLLDIALDLIERANNDVLPILDGSALSSALADRQGLPVKIFTREPSNLQTTDAIDDE
ncbi:L,D-transpeptidase ErfK/SrfK [Bathymodiolus japonicus methanotrophic gill symbiont]|uniref:L,D-transpeptidase family protein n=1 Tax=Bathymodiolus japonicus methanotrophic gill symbiont TaxID=113269 RepID=UPI001B5FF8F2|nr:L,D-transpeptidase family protein [Bathymodiolus japonicus methanotrophic gill symbiont]GFO70991.1 L,D-transpeptidase ErfK/SrfK [Bathymodiolus japonicus methanotrophic gill symbiont]